MLPHPLGLTAKPCRLAVQCTFRDKIPLDATGQIVGDGDVVAETHQVMRNLQAVLGAAGLTLSNVVKCSIFVKDLHNFGRINDVYGSYFEDGYAPARETVEVSRLPKDVQVEISCIAVQ